MIAIKLENLTKKYGEFTAVNELNLSIKQGEVYGFIGKNGAGKTTTIHMLLSLIHRTSGDIEVSEEVVDFKDISYKRKIGFVPDVPVFPSYMNAMEYLVYVADIFDLPKEGRKEHLTSLLEFVELENNQKKISQYSRGMKQRLAIAQALVHDPDILVMDEPTSALDPIGRKSVMNVIMQLKGKKTIFYSTHILEDVERVCDRIGLLDKGNLLLEGSIQEIQEMYYKDKYLLVAKEKREELLSLIQKGFPKIDAKVDGFGVEIKLSNAHSANDVLKYVIEKDMTIEQFMPVKTSLEDVFVEVTNENAH
ncbi:MAG: ABC transporter ATP-binding protein [Candidatus Izemoplasmataceae bacterium]